MKHIVAMAAASLLVLTGCQGLTSSKKPVSIYNLRYTASAPSAAASAGVLVVGEPALPSGMETDRIALYLDDGRRMDYYADVLWAESLEDVLQDVVVQAGRSALPNMVVDSPRLNIPGNYRLAVKVLDFAPVYQAGSEAAPYLKVAVNFTLVQLPEKRVLTDFTLESGQAASGNDLTAISGGLETLLQDILTKAFAKVSTATSEFEGTAQ